MAIDGQNLRGAFPVLDTSRSVGTYTANLQKQALQRQAEQKALNDDINKIKLDGLRDADKPDYFQGFESWRSTAQNALKERDFRKKAELQSQADKQFLELQDLVGKSKEYNKIHNDVSARMLDNRFRDQLTDDAVTKWQQSAKLPLSNPNIVKDPSTLARQLDTQKIVGDLTKIDEDLLKQAKYNNPQVRDVRIGNRDATESIYSRSVDPRQQALQYGLKYDTDRNFRAFVQQQYADQFNQLGEDEAKAMAIQDLVKQRPVARQDAPKIQFSDNWREKALFHDQLIRARKDLGSEGIGIAQPITIPYGRANERGNVQLDEYIPISVSKKNFAGSEYIDLKTGKPGGKLNSSNDYEIVGVGNAPFITSGNMKGAISQPNFAKNNPNAIQRKPIIHVQVPASGAMPAKDFFVPYDRLPENVKNSKAIREVLVKFSPAQQTTRSATPTTQAKMVTMILPNGQSGQVPSDQVSAFLKKYPKAKKQ